MGIYDRDYMREGGGDARKPRGSLPLRDRLRFRLWLLFHPGRGKRRGGREA